MLAQTDADSTDYRFPVAVADAPPLADVALSVKCKLGLRRDRLTFALGAWRSIATAACWAIASLGLAPIAALATRASWRDLASWAGTSVRNGLVDGAVAATAIAVVGIIIGRGVARVQAAARVLDALALLAFVTPAAVLGAGLIAVWNRPETQPVYATSAIVVVGYIAR